MKNLAIIFLFLFSVNANGQTIDVEVYCPPMPILKIRPGLWQCQNEPCEVTLTYPNGTMDAIRIKRARSVQEAVNVATIPPTYVHGVLRRSVDPCIAAGTFQNGDVFAMNLPREPVTIKRLQVVAVAIDCPTTIIRKNGDVWEGIVHFDDCPTDPTGLRSRMAREITAHGKLTLRTKAEKVGPPKKSP